MVLGSSCECNNNIWVQKRACRVILYHNNDDFNEGMARRMIIRFLVSFSYVMFSQENPFKLQVALINNILVSVSILSK